MCRRPLRARLALAGLIVFASLTGGCAGRQMLSADAPPGLPSEHELGSTPFFPQEAHQCGPAALATVLGASGIATTPEALVPAVYVPALEGSLQVELAAASRRAGRIAYPVQADLGALAAEIAAGRPVLVLQNLGLSFAPRWHYAVVVGYSLLTDDVVLRSGRTERQVMRASSFASTWARAGRWGLVLLAPGEMPARAALDPYVAAVAAFESAGGRGTVPAWERAVERWPDSETALFGLGNALSATSDAPAAAQCYGALLARTPAHVAARNNLAVVLGEYGCVAAALATLEPAFALAANDPGWFAILNDSRAEIAAHAEDATRCAAIEASLASPACGKAAGSD